MAQGSGNFHVGQLKRVMGDSMPNLILGAPGLSMGSGGFAGKPGPDRDTRVDY